MNGYILKKEEVVSPIKDNRIHFITENDDRYYKVHTHPFYEFLFLKKGDMSIFTEKGIINTKVGNIAIVPPNLNHCSIVSSNTYERYILQVSENTVHQIMSDKNLPLSMLCFIENPSSLPCDNYFYFINLLGRIDSVRNSNEYNNSFIMKELNKCYLYEFLLNCYKCNDNKTFNKISNTDYIIESACSYINDHFKDSDLSLTKISQEIFVSSNYLSKQFKTITGITINEYITMKRIDYSILLLESRYSLMDTALECGFNDYSTFWREFKKYKGVTPSKILKER